MLTQCTSCAACRSIPDDSTVNTGREHYFPETVDRLERLEIDQGEDLRRCRECGALFHWMDLPQHYGSGNNWEERLVRLTAGQAELARLLLEPPRVPEEPLTLLERLFEVLGRDLTTMLLEWGARRHAAFVGALMPGLVARLERHNDGALTAVMYAWMGKDRTRTAEMLQILYARGDALGKNCHYFRGQCEIQLADLNRKRT